MDIFTLADQAAEYAQRVREHHARRTPRGNPIREQDIAFALTRIQQAMDPLRREIGRFPIVEDVEYRARVLEASDRLQRQRRKLWKLQDKKKG